MDQHLSICKDDDGKAVNSESIAELCVWLGLLMLAGLTLRLLLL